MDVRVYEKADTNLLSAWKILWLKVHDANYFNSPDWFRFTLDSSKSDFSIITVYEKGELIALLPLVHGKKAGVNTLTAPGGKFADKPPLLTLSYNEKVIYAILTNLASLKSFYLDEVGPETADVARRLFPNLRTNISDINYYLPLTDNPYRYASKKEKSKIKNKIAKNHGRLFCELSKDPMGIKIAFGIDDKSSKKNKHMSTNVSDRNIFLAMSARGVNLETDILYYDNLPIAYSIGIKTKTTYLALNTSFDARFFSLSPGKLLLHFLIERLTADGVRVLDFGRGESMLKRDYTKHFRYQYRLYYSDEERELRLWDLANYGYNLITRNEKIYFFSRLLRRLITP